MIARPAGVRAHAQISGAALLECSIRKAYALYGGNCFTRLLYVLRDFRYERLHPCKIAGVALLHSQLLQTLRWPEVALEAVSIFPHKSKSLTQTKWQKSLKFRYFSILEPITPNPTHIHTRPVIVQSRPPLPSRRLVFLSAANRRGDRRPVPAHFSMIY